MHSQRESDTGRGPPTDADDLFDGVQAFDVVDGELMPRSDDGASDDRRGTPST